MRELCRSNPYHKLVLNFFAKFCLKVIFSNFFLMYFSLFVTHPSFFKIFTDKLNLHRGYNHNDITITRIKRLLINEWSPLFLSLVAGIDLYNLRHFVLNF